MKKSILFLFALAISSFIKPVYSQNTVDSLHQLITHSQGKKKGELTLELANHFLTSNIDSSKYYAYQVRDLGKKINNHVLVIRSYSLEGEAYQKENKLKESVSAYLKGVELAEKHNEQSLLGTLYNGIGTCYFYMNNVEKATKYMEMAVVAKKEANDYQYYAIIAANLASLQILQAHYDQSIKTLLDVEKTLIEKKQLNYLASVYNSLGAAYQMGKPTLDSARYYYQKSLETATKTKDYLIMMNATQNLGDLYFSNKNYAKAIEYMKKAIATNELRKVEDQYKPALYGRISAVYDTIGDFRNAYLYKKMQLEVNEQLLTINQKKEVEELEIRYQSEKKEKEIQVQNKEIEKGKNQRNVIVFITVLIFSISGISVYFLFQRRKTAQQFEQEKLKLFENIFHEIRTPLTLINGPIQVMKQSETADKEQLQLMEKNAQKLIALINELLDASKLGKGNYQLHFSTGNVDEFISTIIEQFEGEITSKNMRVIFEKNEIVPLCTYPFNVLEKVVSNLLGNAIKYCPVGSEIYLKATLKEQELIFQISDNGKGIPQKEQKKVFKRFYRGESNVVVGGTGIGLALVKELVELASGTIQLQSNESGTTFIVSLPTKLSEQPTFNSNEGAPLLLLAEDDEDMAAFSISILKETFEVVRVADGQKAIEAIMNQLPDIVLSDVMMPQKDGITLVQEIKSNELTDHIPVVLFSAKSSLESRLQGLKYGADAYISKPFSPEELKLTLQNLLTTIQRNKETYIETVQSEDTFEQRTKSTYAYVNRAIEFIIRNIDSSEYSVNELSDDLAVSRSQLHRKLVALTGFSTTNFIRMIRLEKAKDLLLKNDGNITEIAYKCGFNSQSYFTKSFTEYFGKSPTQMLEKP